MSIYEILTLVCFGASWPFAIAKTVKSRTAKGKSFLFLGLLFIGYVFGVIHKIVNTPGDWVLWLWVLNGCMVATDLTLSAYFALTEDKKPDRS